MHFRIIQNVLLAITLVTTLTSAKTTTCNPNETSNGCGEQGECIPGSQADFYYCCVKSGFDPYMNSCCSGKIEQTEGGGHVCA
ncbi:hypothetical protein BJV82DRAFT_598499 [Fennellomyces sp. T-0311]|nr:hypothetical protein BJV82DRAFT_598499 [Fennellomyces sp. T-0311]